MTAYSDVLHVDEWGAGDRVVLVHGSLATGADEWQAQRPLAEQGFGLVVLDRRGCGRSPEADGEDFVVDADDIATLMGDGAHLVGHSYGGLGAMIAAARRADALLALWRSAGPMPSTAAQLPRPARSMSQVVSSGGV